VYNWQYAHCVDFWAIVLGRACDSQALVERGGEESELKPLVYPLVQVSLGAIKYVMPFIPILFFHKLMICLNTLYVRSLL
jgi:hypothetical protein